VLTWAQCAGQGGQAYVGDGAVCEPNPCVTSGVGGSRLATVTTLRTVPNPFGGATTLYLSGPPAAAARVVIFDAAGRKVRTAWEGRLDGREIPIAWDGKDQAGRETPAGIYLVRVESTAGEAMGRLVKTR
jgi:flagellar hook assembly protein FlgD